MKNKKTLFFYFNKINK
jgi:hypothetical protein